MRKTVALVLLLFAFSGTVLGEDTITIASWNVKNLWGDEEHVSVLARVISQFDVIALQEIKSLEGLDKLMLELNLLEDSRRWDVARSPILGEGDAEEYYAIAFRTDKVQPIEGSAGVYPEMTDDDFSRPPFFATFKTVDSDFTFTLITVHITWGDLASLRTAECHRLAFVWEYVQALDENENDLILLGDFNRNQPTHGAFAPLRQKELQQIIMAEDTYTTYSTSPDKIEGNWYDQMWIDPRYTSEDTAGITGVKKLHEEYFVNAEHPHLEARTNISDHLPIWAEFHTGKDTDSPSLPLNSSPIQFDCVDPQGETFSVINTSATVVDLSGYVVTDNEGTYIFPQGVLLQPGDSIEVGFSEYNKSGSTHGLYLSNTQDELLIYAPGIESPVDSCEWSSQSTISCACGQ